MHCNFDAIKTYLKYDFQIMQKSIKKDLILKRELRREKKIIWECCNFYIFRLAKKCFLRLICPKLFGWLKANCPLMEPGPIGGVPSVGVFLRNPSPYLRELWRNP